MESSLERYYYPRLDEKLLLYFQKLFDNLIKKQREKQSKKKNKPQRKILKKDKESSLNMEQFS